MTGMTTSPPSTSFLGLTSRFASVAILVLTLLACPPISSAGADAPPIAFVTSIQLAYAPASLSLSSSGDHLYVAGGENGSIASYRTSDMSVTKEWKTESGVWYVTPGADPNVVTIVHGGRVGPHELQSISGFDGTLLHSISTNLRLSRPILTSDENRLLVTGQQVEPVGIGIPHLLALSASPLTLIENRSIGVNDSMYVGTPTFDRCQQLLYMYSSVRGFGTRVAVWDGTALDRVPARGGSVLIPNQGSLPRVASGLAVDSVRDLVIVVTSDYDYRDPSGLHGSLRILGRDDRLRLPRGGAVVVDERTGVAYVAGQEANRSRASEDTSPDTLMAVDLDANQILGSVEIGKGSHDLVIDEKTARVYVSNMGDSTISIIQGVQAPDGTQDPVCPSAR